MRTPCAVRYGEPADSTLNMFTSLAYACMCASMRPGMSVRPFTSITRAFLAAMRLSDTSRMVSPSTRTLTASGQSALWPSKSHAFFSSSTSFPQLDDTDLALDQVGDVRGVAHDAEIRRALEAGGQWIHLARARPLEEGAGVPIGREDRAVPHLGEPVEAPDHRRER